MPKISVIMPVYNTKLEYLKQAIESILNQTYTDFEFLILDDCLEDDREEIIKSYNDERIKYYKNESNLGVAKSYNKLIDLATAPYVAMMNHDDIAYKNKLEVQLNFMQNNPNIGLCGTGYKKFGEINRFKTIYNPATDEEIKSLLLFKSPIHNPTIMFRKSIVDTHKIRYNENYISLNDRIFCHDFSKYSELANIKEVLYKYRFHDEMTSKTKKEQIRKERAVFHKLWFAYNNIELSAEEIDIFDNYTTYGRCKITDMETIKTICSTLEKLVQINKEQHIINETAFTKVCATYYRKRCMNAVYNGKLNIKELLENTILPLPKRTTIKLCNAIMGWRK